MVIQSNIFRKTWVAEDLKRKVKRKKAIRNFLLKKSVSNMAPYVNLFIKIKIDGKGYVTL